MKKDIIIQIDVKSEKALKDISKLTKEFEALSKASEKLNKKQMQAGNIADLEKQLYQAMDDDFNTAQAIGYLFDGARCINRLVAEKKFRKKADKVAKELNEIEKEDRKGDGEK